MAYEYDVALSFAGEDRDYVEKVAAYLKDKGINVFYDDYEKVKLWGKDLYIHLDEVYRKKAKYCVMFLSKAYASKVWTNHERSSAQARAFGEKEEYILPVRFDNTEIPGIRPTVGYLDLKGISPEELGESIIKKIGRADLMKESTISQEFRKPRISRKRTFNPYNEAQKIISFILDEIKKRCYVLSKEGISLSVFNREGRTCLRIVSAGECKYSLDMWMGGISGDSSISFYGIEGKMSGISSGSSNAWAEVIWSKEKDAVAIRLQDLSLLDMLGESRDYTKEEFLDALWGKICDVLESEN